MRLRYQTGGDYDWSFLDGYLQSLQSVPVQENPYLDDVAPEEEEEVVPSPAALAPATEQEEQEENAVVFEDENDVYTEDDDSDFYSLLADDAIGFDAYAQAAALGDPTAAGSGDIRAQLAAKESDGMGGYQAYNSKGGGQGAVGKYQFRWNIWKDNIKKVTGLGTKEAFLKNPEKQEQFFDWYLKNELNPAVGRIKGAVKSNLSDSQLQKLVHFRGEKGAKDYLTGLVPDKPEEYNIPISQYLKQAGGVALTPEQQYVGLNDPSLDQLVLPLQGFNPIRGLDSGQPVQVMDDLGNLQILHGPDDIAQMFGNVYEQRMNPYYG